jgi:predicted nucleotidyltransferase
LARCAASAALARSIRPEEAPAMIARLPVEADTLAEVCKRHRIRKLSLFGSQLDGTARADSDFDLLVEFEPDAEVTLFDIARVEIELSSLLGGRKVDLRTAEDLSRHFRDEVVRRAQPQYVAA